VKEEDVIIDMSKGKPTGYALVFVNTAEDAQEAIKELQGKYIGNRYVDVFTPTVRQQ
jgi:RNA recognition motif-containing protein